jgi:hypothetical protein
MAALGKPPQTGQMRVAQPPLNPLGVVSTMPIWVCWGDQTTSM